MHLADVKGEDGENEEDQLTGSRHHRVDYSTATKLRVAAITVSWVSVIFSLSTGIAALVTSPVHHSQSLFGYGLDAILDAISSIVVLWRFYGNDRSVYSAHRERVACIAIGVLFLVAAGSLIAKSTKALLNQILEDNAELLYILALVNAVVSLILAVTKVVLGYKLESKALITDSVITFTGFAVSAGSFCCLVTTEHYEELWYMDPVIGILCGVFLLVWGIKLLVEMTCIYKKDVKSW